MPIQPRDWHLSPALVLLARAEFLDGQATDLEEEALELESRAKAARDDAAKLRAQSIRLRSTIVQDPTPDAVPTDQPEGTQSSQGED